MTAELFLTCFLACLFAFVVVVVLSIQVIGFLIKRWFIRNLPEIIHAATAVPHGGQDMQFVHELMANAANTPPGVAPHLANVRCQCGREQAVPLDQPLPLFLGSVGWQFEPERFDGWACPSCVASIPSARSS